MVSNITSNMNNFGTLLEKLYIPHIYCTDNMLHLTYNNDCLDSCYNRVVSGVANDADDINMDEVVELHTMAKV